MSGRALAGFRIPQPRFPPTYRVARGVAGFAYVDFEAELRFVAAVRRREEKIRRQRARRSLVQQQKRLQPQPQTQPQNQSSSLDQAQLASPRTRKERRRNRRIQTEDAALPMRRLKGPFPSRLLQDDFESVASTELNMNNIAKNECDEIESPLSPLQAAMTPALAAAAAEPEYKSDGLDTSTTSSDSSDEGAARRRNIRQRSRHTSMALWVHSIRSPVPTTPTSAMTPQSAARKQQYMAEAARMKFEEVAHATTSALRSAPQHAVDTARFTRNAASAAATDATSAALAAEAAVVQRFTSRDRRIPKLPAYCDRLAWHSAHGLNQRLRAHAFRAGADFVTSDHKPVYTRLSVKPTPPLPPPLSTAQAKQLAFKRAHCRSSSSLLQAPQVRFDAAAGPLGALKHATGSRISNLKEKVGGVVPTISSTHSRTTTPTDSANSSDSSSSSNSSSSNSSLDRSNRAEDWANMPEMVLELEVSDLRGKALPAGDFAGYSDPYLVFVPNPCPPHQPAEVENDVPRDAPSSGAASAMDEADVGHADEELARTSVQVRTLNPHWPDVITVRIPIPNPWRASNIHSGRGGSNYNKPSNGDRHEDTKNDDESSARAAENDCDTNSSTDEDEPRWAQGRSGHWYGQHKKRHRDHHGTSSSSRLGNAERGGARDAGNTGSTENGNHNNNRSSSSVGFDFWSHEPRLPYLGRLSLLAMDRDPLTQDSILGNCSLSLRECVLYARKATLLKLARNRAAARQAGKFGEQNTDKSTSSCSGSSSSSSSSSSSNSSGLIGAWHFRRDLVRCGVAHGELRGVVRVTVLDGRTGLPFALELPEHLTSDGSQSSTMGSRIVEGLTQWLPS